MLDRVNNIIKPDVKLRIVHQTKKTQMFFPNKDIVSQAVSTNLVYMYECGQCLGLTYVGETIRQSATRAEEHIK